MFGLFEAGMPILGLVFGRGLASTLGSAARWIGAGLLIAAGGYALIRAWRGSGEEAPAQSEGGIGRLLVTGIALSIDNLAVGFALGTYHVNLAVAALVIGAVSVALSLIGLELGAKIGTRTGQRGELLGGLILIAVGIAVATRVI